MTIKSRLKCKIGRHGLTQSQQMRRKKTWRRQNLNKVRSIQININDKNQVANQLTKTILLKWHFWWSSLTFFFLCISFPFVLTSFLHFVSLYFVSCFYLLVAYLLKCLFFFFARNSWISRSSTFSLCPNFVHVVVFISHFAQNLFNFSCLISPCWYFTLIFHLKCTWHEKFFCLFERHFEIQ